MTKMPDTAELLTCPCGHDWTEHAERGCTFPRCGCSRPMMATAAAEDRAACAWELTGALGLTVRVKGDDLVIDPDDVDQWWPPIRDRVVRAYRETL